MSGRGPIVVKIGGSTLGVEDTTLDDVVALQRGGERVIVVHGGGAMITEWLERLAQGGAGPSLLPKFQPSSALAPAERRRA